MVEAPAVGGVGLDELASRDLPETLRGSIREGLCGLSSCKYWSLVIQSGPVQATSGKARRIVNDLVVLNGLVLDLVRDFRHAESSARQEAVWTMTFHHRRESVSTAPKFYKFEKGVKVSPSPHNPLGLDVRSAIAPFPTGQTQTLSTRQVGA